MTQETSFFPEPIYMYMHFISISPSLLSVSISPSLFSFPLYLSLSLLFPSLPPSLPLSPSLTPLSPTLPHSPPLPFPLSPHSPSLPPLILSSLSVPKPRFYSLITYLPSATQYSCGTRREARHQKTGRGRYCLS